MADSPETIPAERKPGRALLFAGYLTAIALPVVGLVLGVLILIRRQTWHGVAIVAMSKRCASAT